MNQISTSIFILLVLCLLNQFSHAQISQEYIKQSETFVREAISKSQLDFEQLYKEGYTYKVLADSNVIQSQNVCSLLQKQGDIQSLLTDSRKVYYFLKLKEMIPRCNIEYQTAAIKEVLNKEYANLNTPEKVFYVTALAYELKVDKIYTQSCGVYLQYLQNDGTSRMELANPDNNSNYSTGYILETVQLCLSNGTLKAEEVQKNIDIPLESILINSIQLEEKQICVLESVTTLEISAKIYKLFNTLPIKNLQSYKVFIAQYKNSMLNFLKNNADSAILSPNEKYELVSIYQNVKDSDVVVVKKGSYDLKSKQQAVLVRYENILGERTETTKSLKAVLYKRENVVDGNLVSTNSTNEQWPLEFKINNVQINEPGFHLLKISELDKELFVEKLLFTTSLTVKNIEFEVVQGKGKIPQKYSNQYNQKTKQPKKIQTNQNSFVYVQFQISFTNEKHMFTPSQIVIRLKHPTFTGVTHLVNAEYDDISDSYLAIVDFGDPLTILPYSTTYDIELIVADQRLNRQIIHHFATAETTFKTNRNDKNPPNDADYTVPKPIDHVINDEIISPPILFIYSIVFMMGFCFFFYFVMLKKLDLNWERYTRLSGIQQIYVQLFVLAIIAAYGLLLLFWVQINLMQTVTYICIGFIPFLIVGNLALTSLSEKPE